MIGGLIFKGIFDFFVSLLEYYLEQKYVFLCSNYDFVFVVFMGVLLMFFFGMNYISMWGEYIWCFLWWQGRCVFGCYYFINLEQKLEYWFCVNLELQDIYVIFFI